MKELFNPKFVHFMWDDKLKGRIGFYGDTIGHIMRCVNEYYSDWLCKVTKHDEPNHPFMCANVENSDLVDFYTFFYYDPNYDLKRACLKGEKIQYRKLSDNDEWKDVSCVDDMLTFDNDDNSIYEYRIKPIGTEPNN